MKRARVFWFTGLSGAGKTTIASAAQSELEKAGYKVSIIDGDEVRAKFHRHLGFTRDDIVENNRLIVELCRQERDSYDVIMVPIISPFKASREDARQALAPDFYEVYFSAGLDCVIARDTKGLYAKAKNKEIDNLIGFGGPAYEPPDKPDFSVDSQNGRPAESAAQFVGFVLSRITTMSHER